MYITAPKLRQLILAYRDPNHPPESDTKIISVISQIGIGLIHRYYYRLSLEDQEDAIQDAIIQCLRILPLVDIHKQPFNYLTSCVRNSIRQNVRNINKHQHVDLPDQV